MRIALIIACGVPIAGALFYFSYRFFDDIAAASTGYNATAKGFFEWDYEFIEHEFIEQADGSYQAKIVDSGRRIRLGHLASEIIVSLLVGLAVSTTGFLAIAEHRSAQGEQDEDPKPDNAPS